MTEGGDSKQFLYSLLGKKKLTPDYTVRNSGKFVKPIMSRVDIVFIIYMVLLCENM